MRSLTIQKGEKISSKIDTKKVEGTKRQTSTKVDVDSLPAFSSASATLKGCISGFLPKMASPGVIGKLRKCSFI